jgi:hypothetical protein
LAAFAAGFADDGREFVAKRQAVIAGATPRIGIDIREPG